MPIQTSEYEETLSKMTDSMLVALVLAGEQKAFEQLVRRYQRPLFNFLCHFLRNSEIACDILQSVFLKLYLSLPTLHMEESLQAWLFQVAQNCCLEELHRKHLIFFSQLEETEEDDDVSPMETLLDSHPLSEEVAKQHELQENFRQAIDGLPPKLRQVVLLRYTGQLSFGEIGTILNMPQATAKTHFQQAKPLLCRVLLSFREHDERAP